MQKITSVLKRRAKLFVLLAFIFFVVGVGLWVFSGGEETDAEQTAIAFYKAAWVEGNAKKAVSFGPSGTDASDLKGYEAKGENTPVLIAEYSPGKSYRLYYIYRPADNTMYAVQLTQHKGEWLVTQYDRKENYSMQMIDQAFPQLRGEWKEIQP